MWYCGDFRYFDKIIVCGMCKMFFVLQKLSRLVPLVQLHIWLYFMLQGLFVISFMPVTIKVDRNWIIESNKQIGSEINRVQHADRSNLLYSLEPGPDGFQPFSIHSDQGIIYLNQSLENQANKNFSILVKAVNKQLNSIPSKIEIHVSVIDANQYANVQKPNINNSMGNLYFFTVTIAPSLVTRSSLRKIINESTTSSINIQPTNMFNKSQTIFFNNPIGYLNQHGSLTTLIGFVLVLTILSLILTAFRKKVYLCFFRNKDRHLYEKNDFTKSISNNPSSFSNSVYRDWGRQRALSNRYDSTPWEHLQQNVHFIKQPIGESKPRQNQDNYEFPRNRLKFFDIIGEGAFGQVWRCEVTDSTGSTKVIAVKTLKENANSKEKSDLICEMLIMKQLKPHANVIRLLGCCTEKEPYFLLMEYIDGGKLQSFLREIRNSNQKYYFSRNNIISMNEENRIVTSHNLTSYVYQVAKGMEFLSKNHIVHRDLAARNVLITSDGKCKVADFGFARDISTNHVYERKSDGRLPIRWMAIESLYDNIFTSKSDVWAFGIFMWEVVTLGATPYPGLSAAEVMKKVKDEGYRLEKPEHCRRELYNVMYYCWNDDANIRPTFSELVQLLDKLMLTETDYIELERFPDHSYYNIIHLSDEKV